MSLAGRPVNRSRIQKPGKLNAPDTIPLHAQTAGRNPDLMLIARSKSESLHSWAPYIAAMKRPGLIRSSANYYRAAYAGGARVRELLAAGKLSVPVLSIAGSGSLGAIQLPLVEAFAANIVKHAVIDNAGHFVAEEQPDALLTEVETFLGLDTGCSVSA